MTPFRRSTPVVGGTTRDEAELVGAAQAGDRAAFEGLYQRYAAMVHGITLARVPRGDVDDVHQEVFAKALAELGALREPSAFGSWLAAIARNCAADHYRRARDTVEIPAELPAASPDLVSALGLLDKILELPETYRETLTLRFVEGMTGPEIAQRTGLTPASVRVNLSRGVKLLRERLGIR